MHCGAGRHRYGSTSCWRAGNSLPENELMSKLYAAIFFQLHYQYNNIILDGHYSLLSSQVIMLDLLLSEHMKEHKASKKAGASLHIIMNTLCK